MTKNGVFRIIDQGDKNPFFGLGMNRASTKELFIGHSQFSNHSVS